MDILSANPLYISDGNYSYDFTTGETKVYGGLQGYKELSPGYWGMVAGNSDTNNLVNIDDKNNWAIQAGSNAYLISDFNLDGNVCNKDKNDYLLPNIGKESGLPED